MIILILFLKFLKITFGFLSFRSRGGDVADTLQTHLVDLFATYSDCETCEPNKI